MDDVDTSYHRLRSEVGMVRLPRDGVRVAGPDAAAFLQGQLSQDVLALAPGAAADSFVLSPQGKVDAFVRVVRVAEDDFVLDVDHGFGDAVCARLARFKLRTKADVEPVAVGVVAVRGPGAADLPSSLAPAEAAAEGAGERGTVLLLAVDWPGLSGFDLFSIGAPPGEWPSPGRVPECDPAAFEVLRIEAGVPRMGAELTGDTIPAEAGVVDRSVSFTKGCFTGQELVARIDSRGGNVPRHLRGIVMKGDADAVAGSTVVVDGAEVGVVTSAARSPGFGSAVALAYVKRAVVPPAAARVESAAGAGECEVRTLPLEP